MHVSQLYSQIEFCQHRFAPVRDNIIEVLPTDAINELRSRSMQMNHDRFDAMYAQEILENVVVDRFREGQGQGL